jgi:hypothetical protein
MTNTPRKIATRVLRDLGDEVADLVTPLAFGLSSDGEVFVAGRLREATLYDERGGARFPKSMLDEPHDWVVVRARECGSVRRLHLRNERPNFAYVQALSDGILLVAARCNWQRNGPEENAVVIADDGRALRRFALGDGINDVRATASDDIWVSYFDEGIFGNRGWGNPGPDPIGAAGLVHFGPRGDVRGAYDAAAAGTDAICDAYALNVDRQGNVWLYFYSEFPIVRLREGRYTRWSCSVLGSHVLAAWESRALLVGSYGEPASARIMDLRHDGSARIVEEAIVVTPEGAPITPMRAVSIGPEVFFFDGKRVLGLGEWC